jgi:CRISPR-associated endonuclease/helicase Cas3
MGIDLKKYRSHPDKFLHVHLENVKSGVKTSLKMAELAAIFHDIGKINPHFQRKLDNANYIGYTQHAYLSALAWLCFCQENDDLAIEWGLSNAQILSVATMIAHHHGHLPDLKTQESRIFSERPARQLSDFLKTEVDLPLSDFLRILLPHKPFSITDYKEDWLYANLYPKKIAKEIDNPLDFFLETQFGFACLLESDKRDASDNKHFNRVTLGAQLKSIFATRLEEKFSKFVKDSDLNELRTQMRERAVQNIRTELDEKKRVFTLTAPTGAGKTMMLLALAKEILQRESDLSIIYALPFLAITEQVEAECKKVFPENLVFRIDSKSENKRINEIQADLDANPSSENLKKLLREVFSETTFDYPFIVTTFVQLFETLVSNRNSTLLKLPNFGKSILLLDEIQALPPNLYIFFTALLDAFCKKSGSYAIISTATMPHLALPERSYKQVSDDKRPDLLFTSYEKPAELLSGENYYDYPIFNRYRVVRLKRENFYIKDLAHEIRSQKGSCLVILNTIDDTKQLYRLLNGNDDEEIDDFTDDLEVWRYPHYPRYKITDDEFNADVSKGEHILLNNALLSIVSADVTNFEGEYILLNTHFTLNDRRWKLELCRQRLSKGERVVLISTQLIEAGVDIDFPILYRDMCPLPNLIQSAGRCNRNGKSSPGTVYLFELKRKNGKPSSTMIYRYPEWFLEFTKQNINDTVNESEMFSKQQEFSKKVKSYLEIGWHEQQSIHMVKCINHLEFEQLGKFRLINDEQFGKEYRYYIPHDGKDKDFEELTQLIAYYKAAPFNSDEARALKKQVERHFKAMSNNTVTIRLPPTAEPNAPASDGDEVMGIRKIAQFRDYSSGTGINLKPNSGCII